MKYMTAGKKGEEGQESWDPKDITLGVSLIEEHGTFFHVNMLRLASQVACFKGRGRGRHPENC